MRTEVEPPSERSCGTIVEGTWTVASNQIRVRDMDGRLYTQPLGPNDDPAVIARRLLKDKYDKHAAFYAPIQ